MNTKKIIILAVILIAILGVMATWYLINDQQDNGSVCYYNLPNSNEKMKRECNTINVYFEYIDNYQYTKEDVIEAKKKAQQILGKYNARIVEPSKWSLVFSSDNDLQNAQNELKRIGSTNMDSKKSVLEINDDSQSDSNEDYQSYYQIQRNNYYDHALTVFFGHFPPDNKLQNYINNVVQKNNGQVIDPLTTANDEYQWWNIYIPNDNEIKNLKKELENINGVGAVNYSIISNIESSFDV